MIKNKIARNISSDGNQVFHDTTLIGDGTPNSKLRVNKIVLPTVLASVADAMNATPGTLIYVPDYLGGELYIRLENGWKSIITNDIA